MKMQMENQLFFVDNFKYQYFRDQTGQLWRRLFRPLKIGMESKWNKVKG